MGYPGTQPKHAWLGSKIRRARKDAGLSHDKLAAAVGSSRTHLIRLEHGIHKPSDVLLSSIAQATGKDIEFFQQEAAEDEDEDAAALGALTTEDLLRALFERVNPATATRGTA